MTAAELGADALAHRDWRLSLVDAHAAAAAGVVVDLDARARGGRHFHAITGCAFVGTRRGEGAAGP